MSYERLSAQDAALLCAQDPAAPLIIGAVAVFDGGTLLEPGTGLDLERIRLVVERRLDRMPRLRQRLLSVPLDQGPPVWVDDPAFDIRHHVRSAVLPAPAGARELRDFIARLLEQPLDAGRPLWELWLLHVPEIEPIEDDRVVAVLKASHVMADGISLLGFAWAMLDTEPGAADASETDGATSAGAPDAASRHGGPALPNPAQLWLETVVGRSLHGMAVVGRAAASATRHPGRTVRDAAAFARGAAALAVPAPRSPITRPVGSRRDMTWLRLPLDEVRVVASDQGVTLNDVVLSIVAEGLDTYVHPGSGIQPWSGPRVLVPVSTHRPDDPAGLGNRFTMMVTELPSGDTDPLRRVQRVHEATQTCKSSGQTAVGTWLFGVSELVPVRLLRRVAPALIRRQPFANLAVTNMPGTDAPLYLAGAPLLELYPFITVTGNIGVIVGALSYLGGLGISLTVDADLVPDLDRLAAAIEAAAEALLDGAPRPEAARA